MGWIWIASVHMVEGDAIGLRASPAASVSRLGCSNHSWLTTYRIFKWSLTLPPWRFSLGPTSIRTAHILSGERQQMIFCLFVLVFSMSSNTTKINKSTHLSAMEGQSHDFFTYKTMPPLILRILLIHIPNFFFFIPPTFFLSENKMGSFDETFKW